MPSRWGRERPAGVDRSGRGPLRRIHRRTGRGRGHGVAVRCRRCAGLLCPLPLSCNVFRSTGRGTGPPSRSSAAVRVLADGHRQDERLGAVPGPGRPAVGCRRRPLLPSAARRLRRYRPHPGLRSPMGPGPVVGPGATGGAARRPSRAGHRRATRRRRRRVACRVRPTRPSDGRATTTLVSGSIARHALSCRDDRYTTPAPQTGRRSGPGQRVGRRAARPRPDRSPLPRADRTEPATLDRAPRRTRAARARRVPHPGKNRR